MELRTQVQKVFASLKGFNEKQITGLEKGIYNAAIEYAKAKNIPLNWQSPIFREIYMSKGRAIYANLNPDTYVKNNSLRGRIETGEIKPHEVANMAPVTLFPEHWKGIVEEEMTRMKEAYELKIVAMTDQVVCGKCKNRQITYHEQQTRSADEGTTVFYRCLVCNNKWRHA